MHSTYRALVRQTCPLRLLACLNSGLATKTSQGELSQTKFVFALPGAALSFEAEPILFAQDYAARVRQQTEIAQFESNAGCFRP